MKERTLAFIRSLGHNVISVWGCQNPELSQCFLKKEFVPYLYFIVFDFKAILTKLDFQQTSNLTIDSQHNPVSVAINDKLTKQPIFLEDSDPEALIQEFMEELLQRQKLISEEVNNGYPMQDKESIPELVRYRWTT